MSAQPRQPRCHPGLIPQGEAGSPPVRLALEGLAEESPELGQVALTRGVGDDLPRVLRAAAGAVAGCGAQAPCGEIVAIRATPDPWSCHEKQSTVLMWPSLGRHGSVSSLPPSSTRPALVPSQ